MIIKAWGEATPMNISHCERAHGQMRVGLHSSGPVRSLVDEDVLETLADAFIKRFMNTESDFIWKNPEKDDAHVIRYKYDPLPDRLDDYEPTRERERDFEGNADKGWRP